MVEDNDTDDMAQSSKTDACCSNQSCSNNARPVRRIEPKVGRNDPCPCGNGRKYKKCCGA